MNKLLFALLCISVFGWTIPCRSRTITVDNDGPADFNAIKPAINDSNDGDTVVVMPGFYRETLDFGKKNIVLTSTDPNDPAIVNTTIISKEELKQWAVTISTGSLSGLTISGGLSIQRYDSETSFLPTIKHCCITSTGTAIEVRENANPIIENNIIRANAGIYFWKTKQSIIRNNSIVSASPGSGSGFIYRMHTDLPAITGNIITNWKHGIHFTYTSLMDKRKELITYNNVWGNTYNYWIDEYESPFDLTGIQGNISADPLFVDSANGNFHLQPLSPCIDAGDPAAHYPGLTDIDGQPRVFGPRVDMGADELHYAADRLVRIEILGPEKMLEVSSGQFYAVAYDGNGLGINVTNGTIWSLTPPQCGGFNDHGILTLGRIETPLTPTVTAEYPISGIALKAQVPLQISIPDGLVVTGPQKIGENATYQFTAKACYDGRTIIDVSNRVLWSLDPPECGHFDSNGLLTTGKIDYYGNITINARYTVCGAVIDGKMVSQVSLPVILLLTGPREVMENSKARYTTIAHYDTGADVDVTDLATWEVIPDSAGTIVAGLLTTADLPQTQDVTVRATFAVFTNILQREMTVRIYSPHTLSVPSDYKTIQQAIDAAERFDTIIVADGRYTGDGNRDIDFRGKPVTVTSRNGPETCIIDCNGSPQFPHRGFYFKSKEDANAVLDGFTITNGYAFGEYSNRHGGGAIRCDDSSPTIINCIFTANSAAFDGGAVNNLNSSPIFLNCTFIKNVALDNDGGAINNSNSNPIISHCTFTNNSAYDWGGAIRNINKSNPIISNCLFSGNIAANCGGAIYNTRDSEPVIINSTISGNSAHYGGGIYSQELSRDAISNCIVWGNDYEEIYGRNCVVYYSDIQGGWPGTGNFDQDPCFVQPGYWFDPCTPKNSGDDIWVEGDYHLQPGSPCIDRGDNDAILPDIFDLNQNGDTNEPTPLDLDTKPRLSDDPNTPDNGNGTPPIVDLGSYEGPQPGYVLLVSSDFIIVPEGQTATFDVALSSDPLCQIQVTVKYFCGDPDITVLSGAILTFDSSNYRKPQTVTLAASEDVDFLKGRTFFWLDAPRFAPVVVKALEEDNEYISTILYVDANAQGAASGFSWQDAFTDLQDALTLAALVPDIIKEIRVAKGIYKPAKPFSQDRQASFCLINGIAYKGGYAGIGAPDPNARDFTKYETVLSGDIDGNDVPIPDPCGLLYHPSRADNSFHVVTAFDCNSSTTFDGFTVTAGNANGTAYENQCGGGLYAGPTDASYGGTPIVDHCKFIANSARYAGAIYLRNYTWYGGEHSSVKNSIITDNSGSVVLADQITNCIISYNFGGALANYYATVIDSIFSHNRAIGQGGVLSGWNCSPLFIRCSFIANSAERDSSVTGFPPGSGYPGSGVYPHGGAIYIDGCGTCSDSYPEFRYCKFIANSPDAVYLTSNTAGYFVGCILAGNGDAGLIDYSYYGSALVNCTFTGHKWYGITGGGTSYYYDWGWGLYITNCIIWDNLDCPIPPEPDPDYWPPGSSYYPYSPPVNYCCLRSGAGYYKGVGNIECDPCFVRPGYWHPNGTPNDISDDYWVDGDYHLKSAGWRWDAERKTWTWDDVTSRCIDAGSPDSLLGEEMIAVPDDPNNQFGHNLRIDIGAYGGTNQASIPPYDWAILSDINNDGVMNLEDFAYFANRSSFYLQPGLRWWDSGWHDYSTIFTPADLDRNRIVDLYDLTLLADDWLKTSSWR